MITTALIYPPTCDPTAPYISVPALTGYLRAEGLAVLPVDANVEAYDRLLRGQSLEKIAQRLEHRLGRLEAKTKLYHTDQLAYAALWEARSLAPAVSASIDGAVAVLRNASGKHFFSPERYDAAVETIEGALRLISAAYFPLELDFSSYRTPFSFLSLKEVASDARPARNPFYSYYAGELCRRLGAADVRAVGISAAFSSQLQGAYSLAFVLKKKMPGVYITAGGPAITQLFCRLDGRQQKQALGPFDSAVLFEGEQALEKIIRAVDRGRKPAGIICGTRCGDMSRLPCPDFDGMPLEKYFSPSPVLPYDPSRGCYWGKCAFCHYGLTPQGTAPYRQRPVQQVVKHLQGLSRRYGARLFYFSQDAMAPAFALRVAGALTSSGLSVRWATDMRPEPVLSRDACKKLARGGLISAALGVESASPRVLRLINKGTAPDTVQKAIAHLARAGVAVEAMCFTDFPTERAAEALATVRFIGALRSHIALFICGRFELVSGARVALDPEAYGIREIWRLQGDAFQTGIFYEEAATSKTPEEAAHVEKAVNRLSRRWRLHHYPWAGALSTAHTQLWYLRCGPDIFKKTAGPALVTARHSRNRSAAHAHFDSKRAARQSADNEARIWHFLITVRREVSRQAYQRLARKAAAMERKPGIRGKA